MLAVAAPISLVIQQLGGPMAQLSVAAELARFGPDSRPAHRVSLAESQAYCRRLAASHYENFTVASWLLPRHLASHFHAIYAYCRWADDLADEAGSPAESLRLLDWWQEQLDLCYTKQPQHPVFVALLHTIDTFSIPCEPFADLLTAFRQDQHANRYATPDEVLAYCRNSANPVGQLILYLGRCHDPMRGALADSICTGLQLANFCQDVARDWRKGRVYLPRTTLAQADCTDEMFAEMSAQARAYPEFNQALCVEVDRAEGFLRRGFPLIDLMPRELRLEVRLFIEGGLSVLAAIRKLDYDVWRKRPAVSRWQKLGLLVRCWLRTHRPIALGRPRSLGRLQ